MIYWLLGVVVAVVLWGLMWQRQPRIAFGVLPGLLIAWVVFRLVTYYLSTVEKVPVWLPPIPFATVSILLFTAGIIVWFRGEPAPVAREGEHPAQGGQGGHGGHGQQAGHGGQAAESERAGTPGSSAH